MTLGLGDAGMMTRRGGPFDTIGLLAGTDVAMGCATCMMRAVCCRPSSADAAITFIFVASPSQFIASSSSEK